MIKSNSPNKLYNDVTIIDSEDGYTIILDGNLLKTPKSLVLSTEFRPLIEAVALECENQIEQSQSLNMPLFSLLVTAIDYVGPKRKEVITETLQIGAMDLLFYQAQEPIELIRLQEEKWQPIIDWAEETMNVIFHITKKISPIKQTEKTLETLCNRLELLSNIELTIVFVVARISKSLLVSLAFESAIISPSGVADICLLDEIYQMERWGKDEIIVKQHNEIRLEIYDTYRLLRTLY